MKMKFVLEYKNLFRSMLQKHGGVHPEHGGHSLKHVKDKKRFFNDVKKTWAAIKQQRQKKT